MADALILSGGVAKGAFGAGVLAVLLDEVPDLHITRVVATSSGALNGAFVAAAIRSGEVQGAGARLRALWIDDASFGDVFEVSAHGIAAREGISTNARVMSILQRSIPPSTARHPVAFQLVVTATAGYVDPASGSSATTFERVLSFDGATFDDADKLEGLFAAVTAAAAFPVAFLPVELELDGQKVACYDGGLVDNTPIGDALVDPEVTRVFVVAPYPAVLAPHPKDRHGFALLEHLSDILVNERLYRDLREARAVDASLAQLEATLDPASLAKALSALGWTGRRRVEIVELRPDVELGGTGFGAFFSKALREMYVAVGERSARAWLAK
jgi:predicted acylesterase/phospholipase RssA